jgi:Xaa-Pro aminopeptidase
MRSQARSNSHNFQSEEQQNMSLVGPLHDITVYQDRRERLAISMRAQGGGIALIPTGSPRTRNADATYPFRFDSQFYYLSGFTEPNAWLAIVARAGETTQTWLLCQPKNPESETWDGKRWGPDAAQEAFGLDGAASVDEIDHWIADQLCGHAKLFAPLHRSSFPELASQLQRWVNAARQKARGIKQVPTHWIDLTPTISHQRLIKDPHELAVMRESARIAAMGHCAAMRAIKPGITERALEAELLAVFLREGAQAAAYETIVATGANACTLHHAAGASRIAEKDLVLIDAGCELHGYASDITRTFPASGRFTPEQAALYDIVLAAQDAATANTAPGLSFNAGHDAAVKVLTQGLIDEGIIEGSLQTAIEQGLYRPYYMHRTGHWLGLDVHDAGPYRLTEVDTDEPDWRQLEPGMVLTIEPGLYITPGSGAPERFWNIGIRIEDDAVVTESGCELITRGVPVDRKEIEALVRSGD